MIFDGRKRELAEEERAYYQSPISEYVICSRQAASARSDDHDVSNFPRRSVLTGAIAAEVATAAEAASEARTEHVGPSALETAEDFGGGSASAVEVMPPFSGHGCPVPSPLSEADGLALCPRSHSSAVGSPLPLAAAGDGLDSGGAGACDQRRDGTLLGGAVVSVGPWNCDEGRNDPEVQTSDDGTLPGGGAGGDVAQNHP